VPFNLPGVLMFISGGIVAMILTSEHILGRAHRDGLPTVLLGIHLAAIDLGYRLYRKDGHWINPSKGGKVIWMPIWIVGIYCIGRGVVYLLFRK
jgi:hypothetical protein